MNIIGMDEVGRGAWAGPLVVGAVSLSQKVSGLKDSKKLTKYQRQVLAKKIHESADFVGIGLVEATEIDDIGLSKAHYLAYSRAVTDLSGDYQIIIDGNINYLPDLATASCIIKADQTVLEVSAASVIAKVFRDDLMAKYSLEFPDYGFDRHVGYGTKLHIESIVKNGLTPLHRNSYKPIQAFINGPA